MPKRKWTLEKVQAGFKKFEVENGRLPTGPEIDICPDLPSSRQLNRLFGGLPELRKLLGYSETDFSKGKYRSEIGIASNKRSKVSEDALRDILFERFHEPFVHLEKPIDKYRKLRADFYVFNPVKNFAVDVFSTETYHNLDTNVYIKLKKYSHIRELFYLVLTSKNLTAGDVALFNQRKAKNIPTNIKLITVEQFVEIIILIPSYQNPVKNTE